MLIYGPTLAVLAVIGGMDDRPRIGGLVQHHELGVGTITLVPTRSKVVINFHGRKETKLCSLHALELVSSLQTLNGTLCTETCYA